MGINNAEQMGVNHDITEGVTYLTASGIIVLSDGDYDLLLSGELTVEEIYEMVGLQYD